MNSIKIAVLRENSGQAVGTKDLFTEDIHNTKLYTVLCALRKFL